MYTHWSHIHIETDQSRVEDIINLHLPLCFLFKFWGVCPNHTSSLALNLGRTYLPGLWKRYNFRDPHYFGLRISMLWGGALYNLPTCFSLTSYYHIKKTDYWKRIYKQTFKSHLKITNNYLENRYIKQPFQLFSFYIFCPYMKGTVCLWLFGCC